MDFSRVSKKHDVPVAFIDGMWFAESTRGTGKNAFVHRGGDNSSYGHFQALKGTRGDWLRAGCKDPWSRNAETAADGAAYYLQSLKDRYNGDWMKAIAAYNVGFGNLDKTIARYGDDWYEHCSDMYLRNGTIKHRGRITETYVRKVMFENIDPKMFEAGLLDDNQEIARQLGMRPDELRKTARSLMRAGLIRTPHIELDMALLLSDDAVSTGEPSLSGVSSVLPWQGGQSANPQTVFPGEPLPPPPMIRQATPAAWPTIQATEPPMTRLAPERTAPIIKPLEPPAERTPAPSRLVPIIQHVPAPVRSSIAQPAPAAAPIIQTLEPPISSTPALTERAEPIVVRPTAPAPVERAKTPIQHQAAPIEPSPGPSKTPSAPPDPRHYVRPRTLTI